MRGNPSPAVLTCLPRPLTTPGQTSTTPGRPNRRVEPTPGTSNPHLAHIHPKLPLCPGRGRLPRMRLVTTAREGPEQASLPVHLANPKDCNAAVT